MGLGFLEASRNGLDLPSVWVRAPSQAVGNQSQDIRKETPVLTLPLSEKKKKQKKPHFSPFEPLQTLRRFWREGEAILCMCELGF